jgi:hypothetical protein
MAKNRFLQGRSPMGYPISPTVPQIVPQVKPQVEIGELGCFEGQPAEAEMAFEMRCCDTICQPPQAVTNALLADSNLSALPEGVTNSSVEHR